MSSAIDFFSPIGNIKPYLKAAFEGFAGSGKTLTAAKIIIGMHKRIGSTKPVTMFDTELASKFLKPVFEEAGIKAVVKTSRSLADLKIAMAHCRAGYSDFLLIDSISHIWEDFLQAYTEKKKQEKNLKGAYRLQFEDWGTIKPTWKREFSDPLVRDPYHIIFTGRAGYEYGNEMVEQENGKKKREIYKSGIKMKVEGETAYEPDILVLMERFEELLEETKKVWREATVIKDRSQLLDGKTFENPTYENFAPAIELLLTDPEIRNTHPDADAASLVASEGNAREFLKSQAILLEKIESFMVSCGFAGQAVEAKKNKVAALDYAFDTTSWTEITGLRPIRLEHGLALLRAYAQAQASGPEALHRLLNGAKPDDEPAWDRSPPPEVTAALANAEATRGATSQDGAVTANKSGDTKDAPQGQPGSSGAESAIGPKDPEKADSDVGAKEPEKTESAAEASAELTPRPTYDTRSFREIAEAAKRNTRRQRKGKIDQAELQLPASPEPPSYVDRGPCEVHEDCRLSDGHAGGCELVGVGP